MNRSLASIDRLLTKLEDAVTPPPPREDGVRVIVIRCIEDPDPPEGGIDAYMSAHPPCCDSGWPRMVRWDGAAFSEESPRCWSCRAETEG